MSETLPEFVLLRPGSLAEAIEARARHPEARVLGGGTDLIVNMRRGLVETPVLIDVSKIPALGTIELSEKRLHIGAAVPLAKLAAHADLRRSFPALAEAAAAVAGPGHRSAATIGGNLCLDTRCVYYNQSHWWRKSIGYCLKYKGDTCHVAPQGNRCRAAFSGDLAPAMIVHDAEIEIAGPKGGRRLTLSNFYHDDGASHLALGTDEVLVGITMPIAGWHSAYAKARVRDSIDFPLVGVAVALRREAKSAQVRIAVTGTDSRPFALADVDRPWALPPSEEALSRLDKLVQKQVSPVRTTTTAAHYRRLAASALARRLVQQLASEE